MTRILTDQVLIIEDDVEVNSVLADIVVSLGLEAHRCFNGRQALDMLIEKNVKPVLVICDINMPEMNGIEFVKYQLAKNLCLNICMLTADTSSDAILQCLKLGVTDYITKPFNVMELSDKISTLIEIGKSKMKLREMNAKNSEVNQAEQTENMLRVVNSGTGKKTE